jgi:hypothetical protein
MLAIAIMGLLGSAGAAFMGLVQLEDASALRVRALADESADERETYESVDEMIDLARRRVGGNEWRSLVRTGVRSDSATRIIESKYGAGGVPSTDERAEIEIRVRVAAQKEQHGKRTLLAAVILTFATVASLFALPWIWFGGRVRRQP